MCACTYTFIAPAEMQPTHVQNPGKQILDLCLYPLAGDALVCIFLSQPAKTNTNIKRNMRRFSEYITVCLTARYVSMHMCLYYCWRVFLFIFMMTANNQMKINDRQRAGGRRCT